MPEEYESPGTVATEAFLHSAEGILHVLEHLAEHEGSPLGAVAGVAGHVLAAKEMGVDLYNAVAAARAGNWTEFGHAASDLSTTACNVATLGILGAVIGFHDLGIAAQHAAGGEGLTFAQQDHADLDSLQDDIANWLFNHLHPEAVPDATLSASSGTGHHSSTAYEPLACEALQALHPAKDEVIHLPGFVVTPGHHGTSHQDGASATTAHPVHAHTELVPAHSSSFLNDFGHKELPANMEGVWQAQNLQFWNVAEGATTFHAGHHYAVALDHYHVVDIQIQHVPQAEQMALSHIYDAPIHSAPFVGSDTPISDTPIFHSFHHHF